MKEEILDITKKLYHNHLTPEIATNLLLDLFAVSGRSEKSKCQCKKAQFTRDVDADFNPLCGRCGKAI